MPPKKAPDKPMPRKRTQTPKAKIVAKTPTQSKTRKDDTSSDNSEEEVQASTTNALEVDWKDQDLSLSLVALIMENRAGSMKLLRHTHSKGVFVLTGFTVVLSNANIIEVDIGLAVWWWNRSKRDCNHVTVLADLPPRLGRPKWEVPPLISCTNRGIKQSLYPPCGPNVSTTNGSGKPKVNTQWKLAVLLLGDLDKYRDVLATCVKPNQKLVLANKMKNRLRAYVGLTLMANITQDYDTEMGQMGAGIQNASEIDMSIENPFTTKWAEISAACPWYFDMRNLIAQCPNLVPTGVGHSSTGIAADIIILGSTTPGDKEEQDELASTASAPLSGWGSSPEPDMRGHSKHMFSQIVEDLGGSGDDYSLLSPMLSESALCDYDEQTLDDDGLILDDTDPGEAMEGTVRTKGQDTHRKNPAKTIASNPAVAVPATAPKAPMKTKIAEFSEIVKNEEKMRQKELELVSLRMCHASKVTQMRQAHELRMAGVSSSSASHVPNFFDTNSLSSRSHYTPSEPPDYADCFDFGASAGPLTLRLQPFPFINVFKRIQIVRCPIGRIEAHASQFSNYPFYRFLQTKTKWLEPYLISSDTDFSFPPLPNYYPAHEDEGNLPFGAHHLRN
ncbi:hypothetical protein B0H10DRAFT_1962287 [Mycena sp. CBHHK59/15]|nr:hypothetical protein B0H10DRAFT_1962287 [Mycena sp. CBHHK59/15]